MYSHHEQPRPPWGRDWTRHTPPSSSMRVSDAERREVTDALCRHFADGRLDEAELNDRLARATGATTRADLAPLLSDLPRFDAPVAAPRPRRSPRLAWILLALVALTSAGSAASHLLHPHIPWLPIALLVWVLLWRRRRPRRHRRELSGW